MDTTFQRRHGGALVDVGQQSQMPSKLRDTLEDDESYGMMLGLTFSSKHKL